jgi:hypothetical protein
MLLGCLFTAWSSAVELLYGNMSVDENGQQWDGLPRPPHDIAHRFVLVEQLGDSQAYELTWRYSAFAFLTAIGATVVFCLGLKLWEALFGMPLRL